METKEMKVLVEKATIKLLPGEEIHDFTRVLSQEGGRYVCKALGITPKTGGCWLVAAYADKAVFSSYKQSENAPNRYHMVKFARKDGKFEFSDMAEVEKKTIYKPKNLKDAFATIKKGENKSIWEDVLR